MPRGSKTRIIELFNLGLTYDEISKQLRCSKGTISFHCSKLRQKDDKWSKENIEKYQELYNLGYSLKKLQNQFKISRQTLAKYIKTRKKASKFEVKEKIKNRSNLYRFNVKTKCVEYKGGKCNICGYNGHISALEFHHLNPSEKDFTISGGTKSFENLKNELDKCILVCSNCHREIHAGLHPELNPLPDTQLKG